MKFEMNRLTSYDDDSLIKEVRRVAEENGSDSLSIEEFNKRSRVNSTTLTRRFGSWREVLIKAQLADKWAHATHHGMSTEELLARIRDCARELGKQEITRDDFVAHTGIGQKILLGRFGSWKNALEAAGLAQSRLGMRYSDDECFENLLEVWTSLGRPPKYSEMQDSPSRITGKAYLRFGSWTRALEAFVVRVNSDDRTNNLEQEIDGSINQASNPTKQVGPENKARSRNMSLGLRFEVLSRDNFKCQLCGNSPATDQTCKLHVDHILPFSLGGESSLGNLRSLCEKCNIGRGNRHID